MRMYSQQVLLLILLLVSTLSAPIYLFGGPLTTYQSPVYTDVLAATGRTPKPNCDPSWISTDCPRIAIVTSGAETAADGFKEYAYGEGDILPFGPIFTRLGALAKHVTVHADNYLKTADIMTEEGQSNYAILQRADIVLFNGGDATRHMLSWYTETLYPNTIFSKLQRRVANSQVVIVAILEGSSVVGPAAYGSGTPFGYLYFNQLAGLYRLEPSEGPLEDRRNGTSGLQYEQNGAWVKGFSFVNDLICDISFDSQGRIGRLVPALDALNVKLGVGIDESAVLKVDRGAAQVLGEGGVTVVDFEDSYRVASHYFHRKNIKLHYLTNGDIFSLRMRQLVTTKSPITAPALAGFQDSDDILGESEMKRLVVRLVDQKATANQGNTQIPLKYPISTPEFSLLFYKDEHTQGYKSGGQVTAFNVRLDISAQVRS